MAPIVEKDMCHLFQKNGIKHTRLVCLVDVIIKRSISKFICPLEYQVETHFTTAIPTQNYIPRFFPKDVGSKNIKF